MPGPLPTGEAARRNAPTIPTTSLPASGRSGRAPKVPASIALGKAGKAWWAWAWHTPQAAAWSDGDLYTVARRASIEDDIVALAEVEGLDFADVRGADSAAEVKQAVQRLAALCTGRTALLREARELDDRLGLTPKAMAALRWKIVQDEQPEKAKARPHRQLKVV